MQRRVCGIKSHLIYIQFKKPDLPGEHGEKGNIMETITLYRTSSGFRNIPDRITLRPVSELSEEFGRYHLPEGSYVAQSQMGEMMVYDEKGNYYDLSMVHYSSNAIRLLNTKKNIILSPAPIEYEITGAQIIHDRRIEIGLSQQQLANASNLNVRQIQKIEKGEIDIANISLINAIAIADALGLPPRDLLGK